MSYLTCPKCRNNLVETVVQAEGDLIIINYYCPACRTIYSRRMPKEALPLIEIGKM